MARGSAWDVIRDIDSILFGDGQPRKLRLNTGMVQLQGNDDIAAGPEAAVVFLGDLRAVLGTFTPGIDESVNQAARALAVTAGMESWPGHNGWRSRS